MRSASTKFLDVIVGFFRRNADEAAPSIVRAGDDVAEGTIRSLTTLTPSSLLDDAIDAASKTRRGSKSGLLGRPSAREAGQLQSVALRSINGNISEAAEAAARLRNPNLDDLSDRMFDRAIARERTRIIDELGIDVDGMAYRAATRVANGGLAYRTLSTTGSVLGKSMMVAPVAVPLAGAGALYYAGSSLMDSFNNLNLGGLIPGLGSSPDSPTSQAGLSGGASNIFNTVSGGLEYLGMAPWAADIITAFGAFGAIRGAMFAVEAATGLNKIPGVGLLTTVAALVITANMAFNGEPDVEAAHNRAPSSGTTPLAPAMQ